MKQTEAAIVGPLNCSAVVRRLEMRVKQSALVSPNLRREVRERLVAWTLREIGDLFRDHGFSAATDWQPNTSGERRTYIEQFFHSVDWHSRSDVESMLGVFEAILDEAERQEAIDSGAATYNWSATFLRLLARDGFVRDDVGKLRPRWISLSTSALSTLPIESAIPVLLRRMWASVDDDPEAAIGAAKESIEAAAKHVLQSLGESASPSESMPGLIARAQEALGVHAKSVDATKPGSDSIRSILSSLSKVALGVNDLRRDYGTGHGRATRPSALSSRHSRLAAQAADAWVTFVLETARQRNA